MGFLDIFRRGIKRLPRDWQFYTRTSSLDFQMKTKSPYETYDEEAENLRICAFSYMRNHGGREQGKESFTCVTSKKLVLYAYHFDDGRKDDSGRWISNWLMVYLTPEEAKKYTPKDFASEMYSKKINIGITYPTGFDFASKFPVVWDDEKIMESNDPLFLKKHKKAQQRDSSLFKKAFQKQNLAWQASKKEDATFLTTTYIPEKSRNK